MQYPSYTSVYDHLLQYRAILMSRKWWYGHSAQYSFLLTSFYIPTNNECVSMKSNMSVILINPIHFMHVETCNVGLCEDMYCGSDTFCNGHCTDLATDTDNCGFCGNACPAGINCVNSGWLVAFAFAFDSKVEKRTWDFAVFFSCFRSGNEPLVLKEPIVYPS